MEVLCETTACHNLCADHVRDALRISKLFKTMICETQSSLKSERVKRCVEVSPSVARTPKSLKTNSKEQAGPVYTRRRRRELLYSTNPLPGMEVSTKLSVLLVLLRKFVSICCVRILNFLSVDPVKSFRHTMNY